MSAEHPQDEELDVVRAELDRLAARRIDGWTVVDAQHYGKLIEREHALLDSLRGASSSSGAYTSQR
jgi:hypothetical protein